MVDREVHSGPTRSAEAQRTSPTRRGRAADSDTQRDQHNGEVVGTADKPLVRDHADGSQGVRQQVSRPGSVSPGVASMTTTPEATGDAANASQF